MDMLLEQLGAMGASRSRLGKLFGGASVLNRRDGCRPRIPQRRSRAPFAQGGS
jgi:chemotaxis receptor (MCP) glutamine deamidase CheD